MKHKILVQ